MDRRQALWSMAGALVGSSAIAASLPARGGSARALGLQLFTVWATLEKDLDGTLKAVADIGYKYVETMGAFGRDPQRLREQLARHGLAARSQHVMPSDLYPMLVAFEAGKLSVEDIFRRMNESASMDRIEVIVEEAISRARLLGQEYIVWNINSTEPLASPRALDRCCRALNAAGRLCAKEGMAFAVHNHDFEFRRIDGYVPYDVLLENTDPAAVSFELDTCWTVVGGADPVAYLKRYPKRFSMLHLKDCNDKGEVVLPGTGRVDFHAVLEAARMARIDNYFVEFDHAADQLGVSRSCYDYFVKLE